MLLIARPIIFDRSSYEIEFHVGAPLTKVKERTIQHALTRQAKKPRLRRCSLWVDRFVELLRHGDLVDGALAIFVGGEEGGIRRVVEDRMRMGVL